MTDKEKIMDLLSNYAFYADSRQAEKQLNLFTEDQITHVFTNDGIQTITNKEELLEGFKALNDWDKTFHQLGQSLIKIESDHATGTVYTLAHHIKGSSLLVMYIKYLDHYKKQGDEWFFSQRDLHVEFTENRSL